MKTQSRKVRSAVILMTLAVATALILVGTSSYLGTAHAARQQALPAAAKVVHTDDMQRSDRLDHYKLLADSGASRGENIYFFKCWMCHNKYAKTGPYLKNLYQHESMMSGDPVTDQNVIAKIKEGGPGMPAFQTTLSESDIADLPTYIHEGTFSVEGENTPANPLDTADTHNSSVQSALTSNA